MRVYVYIYVCVHVFMYVCMCIYMCVCVYVCVCVCLMRTVKLLRRGLTVSNSDTTKTILKCYFHISTMNKLACFSTVKQSPVRPIICELTRVGQVKVSNIKIRLCVVRVKRASLFEKKSFMRLSKGWMTCRIKALIVSKKKTENEEKSFPAKGRYSRFFNHLMIIVLPYSNHIMIILRLS
jgi:hypothetical protein